MEGKEVRGVVRWVKGKKEIKVGLRERKKN